MRTFIKILSILFILGTLPPVALSRAEDEQKREDTKQTNTQMSMPLGDLQAVKVKNLTRVAVTDPMIVDIADAKQDSVLIAAKKTGQTMVFLWDDEGKHNIAVRVTGQDLNLMKKRLAHLLAESDLDGLSLEASEAEGRVIVSGNLTKEERARFEKIMSPYYDQIVNLIREKESEEIIQIDMQITELASTLNKALGFDWSTGGNGLNFDYKETLPDLNGAKDWLKIGQFNRTQAIINTINLFVSEGKARELSRPRILVSSGKEASMNVGGEVPITSTTTSAAGGISQSNTTFKQYGVNVTVTPTLRDGKVEVIMNISVSDIDNTFVVPAKETKDIAYKTRSAQTQLTLDDKQTVVFAGLIRYSDSESIKRVPFLSKIPVMGVLFRNYSKPAPDQGRELVVTMTPTIVRTRTYAKDQVKLPTKAHKDFEREVEIVRGYEREPLDGSVAPVDAVVSSPAAPVSSVPSGTSAGNGAAAGSAGGSGLTPLAAASAVPVSKDVTAGATGGGSRVGAGVSPYVRAVQMKVSQAINYPQEALHNGWDGTVKLRLKILRDGSLASAEVLASSGHDVFDRDALNTAKAAAPYPAFSNEMNDKDITIMLPITYNHIATSKPDTQAVVAAY